MFNLIKDHWAKRSIEEVDKSLGGVLAIVEGQSEILGVMVKEIQRLGEVVDGLCREVDLLKKDAESRKLDEIL